MTEARIFPVQNKSVLILENGDFFYGYGMGDFGTALGEICFNTSITGYQEILTDPSYQGQIITFTFPHIGIVGVNKKDYESDKIFASGCIINNPVTPPSNYRSEKSFDSWLKNNKKVCISGVDTRMLTQIIRDNGYCKVLISSNKNGIYDLNKLKNKLREFPSLKFNDLASKISTVKPFCWKDRKKVKLKRNLVFLRNKKFIAVIDFGVKTNILNLLENINYKIVVFPVTFDMERILKLNPSGIFLSNGPGDPLSTYKNNKKNLDKIFMLKVPIFGICLGHQILALAHNAKTEKMHHGHRGSNHPIKNILDKSIEITVQNHGFVVSNKDFPDGINITHKSLFDDTIAGLKIKNKPFFSVQYHPESSPGPRDSRYLFKQFEKEMINYAKKK